MTGPPVDFNGWRVALHKAAAIQPGDPDYAEAQAVKSEALARIGDLERRGTIADAPQDPNALVSGLVGAAHGLSLGTGEPIAGVGRALMGGSFREGAQDYRSGLAAAEAGHPWAGYTGEMAGTVAPIVAAPIRGALMGSAVPVTESVVPGTVARIARGAGTAGVLGGIGGFSAGGDDPGDIGARFGQGAKAAILSAAIGGTLAGFGTRLQTKGVDESNQRLLLAERTNTEAAKGRMYDAMTARASRTAAGPTPPPTPTIPDAVAGRGDIMQALSDYRAGKIGPEDLATAVEYAQRDVASRSATGPVPTRQAGDVTTGQPTPPTPQGAEATKGVVPPASVAGANPPAPAVRGTAGEPQNVATATNPDANVKGIDITGQQPPVSPPPTQPSLLEMQRGVRPSDLQGLDPEQQNQLYDFADKEARVQRETMGRTQRSRTGVGKPFPSPAETPVRNVADLSRNPVFQHADVLARNIVQDPELLQRFPEYAGLDPAGARTLLLKQLMANAQAGRPIPPLTSLGEFLGALRLKKAG